MQRSTPRREANRLSSSSARRVVVALVATSFLGWLLDISGVTHLPSAGFVVADLIVDVLILAGLWLLWRPAWIAALVFTVLGELEFLIHPGRHVAGVVIGLVQLALLALPQLRRGLRAAPSPIRANG